LQHCDKAQWHTEKATNLITLRLLKEILFSKRWDNCWAHAWFNHVSECICKGKGIYLITFQMDYRMRPAPPRGESVNSSNTFFPQHETENPLSASKAGAAGLWKPRNLCTKMNSQTEPFVHRVSGSESARSVCCITVQAVRAEEQVACPEISVPLVVPTRHSQQDFWH